MIHGRAVIPWDPAVGSTDAAIPNQWLDASDTTTIDKAGPAPITNGATVLEWRTKAGTARKYRFTAANGTAPTWDSNVIGSLGGVKFVYSGVGSGQILSADVLTGMRGLSGRTIMIAAKQNTYPIGQTAYAFTTTVTHLTGSADGVQHGMYLAAFYTSGTRRIQSDGGSLNVPYAPDDTNGVAVANGQTIVETSAADWANGANYIYNNGCIPKQFHSAATTAGTTDGARDPYAMSVGAILQENGAFGPNTSNGWMDGYLFEVLDWFTFMTPDQLVGPHDYLCNRWGSGLM